uniref:Putative secreted protein n=1 Tax=Anopheles triannulatus TaxID=58253 RepID=A0A2M4B5M2_9DIPT
MDFFLSPMTAVCSGVSCGVFLVSVFAADSVEIAVTVLMEDSSSEQENLPFCRFRSIEMSPSTVSSRLFCRQSDFFSNVLNLRLSCVMIRCTSQSCSSRFFVTKPAFISACICASKLSCFLSSVDISSGVSGRLGLVAVSGGTYLCRVVSANSVLQ